MIQRSVLILCLALASPVLAQQSPIEEPDENGLDLIERGTRQLFNRFMEEIGPEMQELRDDLKGALDDLSVYHPPEVLPNGDIIIRRKVPLDPVIEEDGEEIEL